MFFYFCINKLNRAAKPSCRECLFQRRIEAHFNQSLGHFGSIDDLFRPIVLTAVINNGSLGNQKSTVKRFFFGGCCILIKPQAKSWPILFRNSTTFWLLHVPWLRSLFFLTNGVDQSDVWIINDDVGSIHRELPNLTLPDLTIPYHAIPYLMYVNVIHTDSACLHAYCRPTTVNVLTHS